MRGGTRAVTSPLLKGLAFTLVTVLATTVLGITIANREGGDTVTYRAHFSDAMALNPGDDVRMSGVRVGEVSDIEVVDRRIAEVEFTVNTEQQLNHGTTARLRFLNLIGQRYIDLDNGGAPDAQPLEPGGLIPEERTTPALDLTALFNGFRPLFQALSPEDVNTLAHELVSVLQGEGGTVDGIVRHVGSLTTTLAERDEVIGRVITNLNTVLAEFTERDEELSRLVTTTQELVSALAADSEPIGDAVEGMAQLSTSLATLLEDGRPEVAASVDALSDFAGTLDDNSPEFEQMVSNLPVKYREIGRTASYGSWLNVFLCEATAEGVPTPPGGSPPGLPVTEARCLG
ncbi:MCE family protein [Haloechinothrix sp. LS1_15]|uniref:MCE family protein n=1 Tax=Haloechinothrix sp. LS1_15 TaxID=2652248 RepID=UPI002945FB8B|nr:MCE family protein [Haloechinothrix sp. LS1_15]MDV6014318.1 MCE family protein [Haloechinothrix sp. LS1_15]